MMKPLFKAVAVALAAAGGFCSCIKSEHDYNLNRYEPGDEVFGDEFTAPLGRVEANVDNILPIEDILNELGLTREDFERNPVVVPGAMIDRQFETQYALSTKIDGDLIHALSAEGEIKIIAEIENSIDLNCDIVVAFLGPSGESALELGAAAGERCSVADGIPGDTASARAEFSVTADDLKAVSSSNGIAVRFTRTDAEDAELHADSRIVFRFTVYKSGGIKL